MTQFFTDYTIFAGWGQLGLALAVFAFASTIYSLFGFGSGLIAVGLLALVMPLEDVVVVLLVINIPIELLVVLRTRHLLPWRRIVLVIVGVVPCVPLGAYLLHTTNPTMMLGLLGLTLVGAGALFLLNPERTAIRPRGAVEVAIGATSGVLGGMLGTGGPPLIIYFELSKLDKIAFRGALLAVFHVMSWVRVTSYVAQDMITAERLISVGTIAPAVALGMVLGTRLHVSTSQAAFRRMVCIGFLALGSVLLVRSISQWS